MAGEVIVTLLKSVNYANEMIFFYFLSLNLMFLSILLSVTWKAVFRVQKILNTNQREYILEFKYVKHIHD